MIIVVTGGRNYKDKEQVFKALNHVHARRGISELYHGGSSGADKLAEEWALKNSVPVKCFPADRKKLGKSAEPVRNIEMLRTAKQNGRAGVVAFPGGRGTQNAVASAKIFKIEVWFPVK